MSVSVLSTAKSLVYGFGNGGKTKVQVVELPDSVKYVEHGFKIKFA